MKTPMQGLPFLYKRLAYVALNVTDINKSIAFYSGQLGLNVHVERQGEKVGLRCDQYAMSLVLYQEDVAGLRRVCFQVASSADLQLAKAHFQSRSYECWDIPAAEIEFLNIAGGFRVHEPITGVTFEYIDCMVEPPKVLDQSLAKIQRLGHVVIRTDKLDEAWAVMNKDFGLLPSDFVIDKAVWARCYPNPFHHSFAMVKSDTPGLHHVNFMVSEIDDVGRARNRLINAGVDIVFGPGRHMPSGSVFLYFLDPDGMTAEFSFGMEEFPEENPREARMLENSAQTMDLWGGMPKPEFCKRGEIAGPEFNE